LRCASVSRTLLILYLRRLVGNVLPAAVFLDPDGEKAGRVVELPSAYETLHPDYDASPPDGLTSARVQALCLVNTTLDNIVHGARQGTAGVQASLRLWLDRQGKQLEAVLEGLLDRGYTVSSPATTDTRRRLGLGRRSNCERPVPIRLCPAAAD
jgi:hypothetical protein